MVKCPNCGSTAQVQRYPWDGFTTGYGELSLSEDYCECGCGCKFIYELFENRLNKTQKEHYKILNRKDLK